MTWPRESEGLLLLQRCGPGFAERYGAAFSLHEIDIDALRLCSADDLTRELGVSAGDVPRILAAAVEATRGEEETGTCGDAVGWQQEGAQLRLSNSGKEGDPGWQRSLVIGSANYRYHHLQEEGLAEGGGGAAGAASGRVGKREVEGATHGGDCEGREEEGEAGCAEARAGGAGGTGDSLACDQQLCRSVNGPEHLLPTATQHCNALKILMSSSARSATASGRKRPAQEANRGFGEGDGAALALRGGKASRGGGRRWFASEGDHPVRRPPPWKTVPGAPPSPSSQPWPSAPPLPFSSAHPPSRPLCPPVSCRPPSPHLLLHIGSVPAFPISPRCCHHNPLAPTELPWLLTGGGGRLILPRAEWAASRGCPQ